MGVEEFIRELAGRKDIEEVVHHETVPASPPVYATPEKGLHEKVSGALAALGIERLYSHQALGIDLARQGENVVVMTPTSSGKSLVYNIPVLESIIEDPEARALYIYPLKGLEQDQLGALRELAGKAGIDAPPAPPPPPGQDPPKAPRAGGRRAFSPGVAEIYDGDVSAYRRQKIRERPPSVVLTNPDMLHLALCAFHSRWEVFFRNLRFVVIDEVHTYRGVFGSHVANVLRRLRRIADWYGSDPRFIACSATIANPGDLAESLTGLPFREVTESGAPQGTRHYLFVNPPPTVSPYTLATRVFTSSVRAGFKTIAFTKARKVTELMHRRIRETDPGLASKISSYRAGFLPEERRAIEARLFSGELKGVISTSALELGVDIGGLDVCVLAGYPGTISSTLQRGGRAGRSGRDSLVVLIALKDALDQYFMRNPTDFFRRSVEAAVLDIDNESILGSHLLCAISELALKGSDRFFDAARCGPVLGSLERESLVRHWTKGDVWYPYRRRGWRPRHRDVSIRETGEAYQIRERGGALLGGSSSTRVLRELHPGAIYLHRGMQWRVVKLDMARREVLCVPADDALYYTRPISEEDTEIVEALGRQSIKGFSITVGRLRVTERVVGYRKIHLYTDRLLGEYALDLPPSVFTTVGVWTEVDEDAVGLIREKRFSVPGGLHALEHSAIATLPLFALCDRMDLGGVSYPANPELGCPAIFIYDGHEGGVGLTRRGFECVEEWLTATMRIMEECDCEVSCPSCTQDPHCGNNNEPLDKRAALVILKKWLG
ncbi:MAG: DEAD/DEAH box helicase [Thermodesulfobacteriota bacterium]